MINISGFSTVRARLLVLMALVIIPIASMSLILATTTYRAVTQSIESAQLQLVSGYAVRARLWFRGSLRTLVSTVESVRAISASQQNCNLVAQRVLEGVPGYEALRIDLGGGVICHFSKDADLTAEELETVARAETTRPFIRSWVGADLANARYGSTIVEGALRIVVHAASRDVGEPWQATLLVDPELLRQVFQIGSADAGVIVALMKRGEQVLASRGAAQDGMAWLPPNETFTEEPLRWQSGAPGGATYAFATHIVASPDLYVLARFDNGPSNAAYTQFLVLCTTPLLTLILLFAAYARMIQFDVVRWIKGIETAARSRTNRPPALAPIGETMPQDIRHVAEAFNTMVTDGGKREEAMRQTLDANQFLLRELNHRVKNSLQVIQSYLALSRRQRTGPQKRHYAETEAMVQVMSVSYRLALIDGTMRPVPIRPFVEEILGNISSSLRGADQWIGVDIDADAGLVVDRVIPLGLGIVEAVVAGLQARGARFVAVALKQLADGHLQLVVSTDGDLSAQAPPPKIVAGLAAQLEAMVRPRMPSEVVNWTFLP